jgi:hypothetical protein
MITGRRFDRKPTELRKVWIEPEKLGKIGSLEEGGKSCQNGHVTETWKRFWDVASRRQVDLSKSRQSSRNIKSSPRPSTFFFLAPWD